MAQIPDDPRPSMNRRFLLTFLFAIALAACDRPVDQASAHRLAREGYAQLENEDPAAAAEIYADLLELLPEDPAPHGNLALSLLRADRADEATDVITAAVDRFPNDSSLLGILGVVQQWRGEVDAALESFSRAAELDPENPESQFGLYRIADQIGADEDSARALDHLSRLRPENLVVLLTLGERALAGGDRAEASRAYLRVRELSWGNEQAAQIADILLLALSDDDLEAARTPSIQLRNLLKITPSYRQSLRELDTGIQGIPIRTLNTLESIPPLPPPLDLSFQPHTLREGPHQQVEVTFLGDDRNPAWVALAADGELVSSAGAGVPSTGTQLLIADLSNDGSVDTIVSSETGVEAFLGRNDGAFEVWDDHGLPALGASGAVAADLDIEGDLDVVLASGSGLRLFQNALTGSLRDVTEHSAALTDSAGVTAIAATDFDQDGDLDLVGSTESGISLWSNLRQGEFERQVLFEAPAASAIAAADLNGDRRFDLATAGPEGLALYLNGEDGFAHQTIGQPGELVAVAIGDLDADGRADVVVAGRGGVFAAQNGGDGFADPVQIYSGPAHDVTLVDIDRDCDLDILAATDDGLIQLEASSDTPYRCLRVALRGLTEGSSKNNVLGLGSLLEVTSDGRTQTFEAQAEETFVGLGEADTAELMRVVWTNGVPQNRFDVAADVTAVEEQLLKGSCPFLYVADGDGFRFVTDLLWGAPAGLPVADGVWASADSSELVHIPGAQPQNGQLELRVTEELWEAAFFDLTRLWVVEVDNDLEVASSLKILPGRSTPESVHATARTRPIAQAIDAAGRDVTELVRARDDTYADGWRRSPYQGVPAEPWTMELDLGVAPDAPIRLLVDAWIFPSDASLNLAVGQRGDLALKAPKVEVLVGSSWRPFLSEMGFPAGKTKTMVVDLPTLPEGARRVRIVGSQWLSFDRIAWSTSPRDEAVKIVAQLLPDDADLRYRGFSELVRVAPNAPHSFDYQRSRERAPWLPFAGNYTRYGDVRELLANADDRSVIMAAGDEMRLIFDLDLPRLAQGKRYEFFLESHGWDKDADRNTYQAAQVEPLPFRAMSGYPYGPDEQFPDGPIYQAYRDQWLTREIRSN